ncbi:MAG: hypothetical protein IPM13_13900 [Phycisphaerales bacterium]|nr:hypothetical protein [Phycisphaerales bacterium]
MQPHAHTAGEQKSTASGARSRAVADRVAAFLHDRDVLCPACRYNLRNLATAACPECGRILSLHVNLDTPRFGALLATVVPMLAYTGVMGLAAGGLALAILHDPRTVMEVPGHIWLLLLLVPVDTLLAGLIYRQRLGFLALHRGARAAIALASWAGHLALTLWTLFVIP